MRAGVWCCCRAASWSGASARFGGARRRSNRGGEGRRRLVRGGVLNVDREPRSLFAAFFISAPRLTECVVGVGLRPTPYSSSVYVQSERSGGGAPRRRRHTNTPSPTASSAPAPSRNGTIGFWRTRSTRAGGAGGKLSG